MDAPGRSLVLIVEEDPTVQTSFDRLDLDRRRDRVRKSDDRARREDNPAQDPADPGWTLERRPGPAAASSTATSFLECCRAPHSSASSSIGAPTTSELIRLTSSESLVAGIVRPRGPNRRATPAQRCRSPTPGAGRHPAPAAPKIRPCDRHDLGPLEFRLALLCECTLSFLGIGGREHRPSDLELPARPSSSDIPSVSRTDRLIASTASGPLSQIDSGDTECLLERLPVGNHPDRSDRLATLLRP